MQDEELEMEMNSVFIPTSSWVACEKARERGSKMESEAARGATRMFAKKGHEVQFEFNNEVFGKTSREDNFERMGRRGGYPMED